jgi:hypothetical protein
VADRNDVRRICLSLPDTGEADDRFAFYVLNRGKRKEIAWIWLERTNPKKPRVPNPAVIGIRVGGDEDKEALIAADPSKFFTEPHYNRFPAILVRLPRIDRIELEELLIDAWRIQASRAQVKALDGTGRPVP